MSEDPPRQRIERSARSRRARLTPAPGTQAEPGRGTDDEDDEAEAADDGPNDERMRREVPPHY